MRVGFVGAGRMGAPMVQPPGRGGPRRRRARPHRRKAPRRRRTRRHTRSTISRRRRHRNDAVVVCVFTDEQVKQICLDGDLVAAMRPGATLVLHTTGSPRTAQSIAARFGHVDVVDAPVSGGPHDIAAGKVTLFVGGADERGGPCPTGAQRVRRPDPARGRDGRRAAGQARQQHVVRRPDRLGRRGRAARRRGSGSTRSALLSALTHGSAQSRVLSMIASAGSADAFISAVGEFIGKDVAVVRKTVRRTGRRSRGDRRRGRCRTQGLNARLSTSLGWDSVTGVGDSADFRDDVSHTVAVTIFQPSVTFPALTSAPRRTQ